MAIRSCCCFSLKTGTNIIAVLSILGTISDIIYTYSQNPPPDNEMHDSNLFKLMHSREFKTVKLIACVTHLVLLVMLLIGTRKGKAHFIFPFVLWTFISLLFSIVFYSSKLMHAFKTGATDPAIIALLLIDLLCFPLTIYFGLVVFSFYLKLLNEEVGPEVSPLRGKI